MEGEGRELTDDEKTVSPGSQLYVAIRDIQAERKTALRNALLAKDYAGCWARVVPGKDQSPNSRIAEVGDLMRLTAINGEFFSFVSCERSLKGGDDKLTPNHYLLHTSEFIVVWVKSGTNMMGVSLEGAELEAGWFMNEDQDEDMEGEDDPEPTAFCEACDGDYPPGRGHVFWFANPIEREGRRFYSACRACIERYDIDERALYTN
jgi:hypothetical protein